MLTPLFTVDQTESHIQLTLKCPYIKAKNVEMLATGTEFHFYASPYHLRLHFSGRLNEDEEKLTAKYDVGKGEITIEIQKETPGEVFEDLHLLSKLLTRPKTETKIKSKENMIEVVNQSFDSANTNANAIQESETDAHQDEEDDEWDYPQQLETTQGITTFAYGFNNSCTSSSQDLESISLEILDIHDISSKPPSQRRSEQVLVENAKFENEMGIYVGWMQDDEEENGELENALKGKVWWEEEITTMKKVLGTEVVVKETIQKLNQLSEELEKSFKRLGNGISDNDVDKSLLDIEDRMSLLQMNPALPAVESVKEEDELSNQFSNFKISNVVGETGADNDEVHQNVNETVARPLIVDLDEPVMPLIVDTSSDISTKHELKTTVEQTQPKTEIIDGQLFELKDIDGREFLERRVSSDSSESDTESELSSDSDSEQSTDSESDSNTSSETTEEETDSLLQHPFQPPLPPSIQLPILPSAPSNPTEKETTTLIHLPQKEYLLSKSMKEKLMLLVVELVFGYAYDMRVTGCEGNVESAWTISKLSATLCGFSLHEDITQTITSLLRRSLVFPYIRNFALSYRCLYDTCLLLSMGTKSVLKALLYVNDRLSRDERTHGVHRAWVGDVLGWVARGGIDDLQWRELSWKIWLEMKDVEFDALELPFEEYQEELDEDVVVGR